MAQLAETALRPEATRETKPLGGHARRRSSPATGQCEVSFRISARNASTEIPLSLWTDLVVEGELVFIRTRRPVPLLKELCGSAVVQGADLPEIEVRAVA